MPEYVQSSFNKERKDKFIMVVPIPEFLKKDVNKEEANRNDNTVNPDSVQFSIYGSIVPKVEIPNVPVRYSYLIVNIRSK